MGNLISNLYVKNKTFQLLVVVCMSALSSEARAGNVYCDTAHSLTFGTNGSAPLSNWIYDSTGGVSAIVGPDGVFHHFATDVNTIYNWNGAGLSNPAWCNYSYALATQMNAAVKETWQRLVDKTSSFCLIENWSCPAHPERAGRILDGYNNARYSADACKQRAVDYYNWCGGGAHRATWRSGDFNNVVATRNAAPGYCNISSAVNYSADALNDACYTFYASESDTSTRCQITLPSCPNHPEYSKASANYKINDTYSNADKSQAACMQRAKDYYGWCGTDQPVKAKYYTNTTLVGEVTYPAPATGSVKGTLDGLTTTAGVSVLTGWACGYGLTSSIDVHVYVGGSGVSGGTFITSGTANQTSESAVATECGSSGTRYRFSIAITDAMKSVHGNKAIFVYGISPTGQENKELSNSGTYLVPMPVTVGSSSGGSSSGGSSSSEDEVSPIDNEYDNRINYITEY